MPNKRPAELDDVERRKGYAGKLMGLPMIESDNVPDPGPLAFGTDVGAHIAADFARAYGEKMDREMMCPEHDWYPLHDGCQICQRCGALDRSHQIP